MRAKAEGVRPPGDLVLCVLADEEDGGDVGARFLVEEHPELFEGIRFALGEFGAFSQTMGGKRFYPIQVAEKQVCRLKATVRGPGGHGSQIHRGGTIARLGKLLRDLDRGRLPVHVTPVLRRQVEATAAALPRAQAAVLRSVLKPRLTDSALRLMGAQGRLLEPAVRNTVNVTTVHGGEKINVVPSEIQLQLDGRSLPGYGPETLLAELRALVGDDVELELVRHDPGPAEPDFGLFDMLAGVIRELDPDGIPVPLLLAGVTDGALLLPARDPDVRLPADAAARRRPVRVAHPRRRRAHPRRGARVRRRGALAGDPEVRVRILVLGGTKFLGRAVSEAALAAGHELTLFNRGETNPELFPEAERLRGNRDGDLSALEGRSWDAVVDPSGYVPRVVRASAELLRDSGHYTFVSSCSVYASFGEPATEASPVATVEDESTEDVEAHYGALKALCEEVVEGVFPGRALHVRAGLIVGPHDPTGRFTYWPHRIARGGEVLVPGSPERPVQLDRRPRPGRVDRAERGGRSRGDLQRDLAVLPAARPARRVPRARRRSRTSTSAWLVEREVGQWMELPLWIDTADPGWRRFMETDVSKAVAAGLTCRPLAETARATLAEAELVEGIGLTPEREAELLSAWHAR